jgi:predicted dehydrogenase
MKFLIAGLGSIGRRHLRNLVALGERDIILYRSGCSTLSDDDLAGFPVETDLQTALAQRPDGVVISNPTALHLDVAIPAAEAGCHLLLEKPISHTMERIDELKAAVARRGCQVLLGFQFRFHPGLQQVARLIAEEAIGRPLSVRANWGEYLPGWHPWEDYRHGYSARSDLGGGVVLTLCHPLDYLCWLFGDMDALWAFEGKLGDLDLSVEDTAEIGMRFCSGVLGSLHLSYNQRPATHRLEIIGTRGTIRWDNADGIVLLYRAPSEADKPQTGPATGNTTTVVYPVLSGGWESFPPPPGFERNTLFMDEMRNFFAAIRGEAHPACTLEDGICAMRLALAVHLSSQEGRIVNMR